MKKTIKIVLIILIVLAVLICGLLVWQKDKLKALKMAMNYNPNQIAEQMSKQNQDLKEQIEAYFPDGIRDFTPEELEQIKKGETTEQQVLAKIIAEAAAASAEDTAATINIETPAQREKIANSIANAVVSAIKDTPTIQIKTDEKKLSKAISETVLSALDAAQANKKTANTQKILTESIAKALTPVLEDTKNVTVKESKDLTLEKVVTETVDKTLQANTENTEKSNVSKENTDTKQEPTANGSGSQQEIISRYTAQLYALEGKYTGMIDSVISAAIAEVKQMKNNGGSLSNIKTSMVSSYMSRLTSLEGQCDAEVAALLSQMTAELKAIGADTSIVATMQSAYENEKSTRLAYYMSKYAF